MKKTIKKLMASILVLSCLMSSAAFAQSERTMDDFDYVYTYHWAREVGFSELFLKGISKEALKRVYFDNVDAEELTIYEKVRNGTGSNPSVRGNIEESVMKFLSTSVVKKSGNKITGVNIYFTAYWKNGYPLNRLTDGIVSNWDASTWIFQNGSFWGQVEDVHNGGGATQTVYSSTRAATQNQGELGWYAPLGNSPLGYTPTVRIGYTLEPKDVNMPATESYESSVTAIYGHNYVGLGITFSLSGPSVSMSGQEDQASETLSFYHG